MKQKLILPALCALLLLSGCTSMLERDYSSSAVHVDYSVVEDSSILRAESYQSLVNSMLYLVGERAGRGTIRLYNYSGNVNADLARARQQVLFRDPLGAYSLSAMEYDCTRILTYYEVTLTYSYRRTAAEVEAVRPVGGVSGLRGELERLVEERQAQSALRLSYFSGDTKLVNQLFRLAYYSDPAIVLDSPRLSLNFYPEEGSDRILDIRVTWPGNSKALADYADSLSEAADALLTAPPADGESYSVQELAGLLRSGLVYDPLGDQTALAALQRSPANDQGVLLAMEYLCQRADIEVLPVSDTSDVQMWLIVSTPSGYRHLLPRDLRPEEDSSSQIPLYTDEELAAQGFTWPAGLYPACVDYSGPASE
ncbi:MAG: hypothetical protein PUB51_03535 [Oscillospiraceae bacterium]|nr:hypothetical protein [Oscillospiraceae bacterium]